jgi:hypothetical protein
MGRKRRSAGSDAGPAPFEFERTLADVEADQGPVDEVEDEVEHVRRPAGGDDTRCICGHDELLLQAFFEVKGGVLAREPLDVETLTCPECSREYEAVLLEDGGVRRGDFLGFVDEEG